MSYGVFVWVLAREIMSSWGHDVSARMVVGNTILHGSYVHSRVVRLAIGPLGAERHSTLESPFTCTSVCPLRLRLPGHRWLRWPQQ